MSAEHCKESDPLWYKDAVIYELHIKSFHDSNDDGIGDFQGLIRKLDYLEDLGITAIWLLPFYPSPLKDDGYDIADYFSVNPDYGTLRDFRMFLREAHKRGIRVITELVVNHTSDQHAWFQRARKAKPGSAWRDFYVWSKTPDKYKEARIIFKDFENSNWAWDPVAQAYYWHRFYSHQPDLNYDNPYVRKEMIRVVDFWLGMGVDGLRLDAVPYLFEHEGTNCENLPETHAFLKELRAHVDAKFKDRMLLAEANQWPDDAANYFGNGDECHMAFHFPVMPRLFMALRTEDRFPIIDMLEQSAQIPENCQWAMFLRNHDELTLEMVTDEERDYMYRAYAQDPRARINLGIRRRLAPLLENNRRRLELMNALLLSLPGTPVIYYGDEIGMGDNYYLGDRDGVRTPMQWTADRNAGFSSANPQKLYLPVVIDLQYHYTAVNVETQAANLSSLLWYMRRLIATRRQSRAFGRGSIEFTSSDNPKVLAFIRKHEEETVLVVANLSRYCQVVRLELPDYAGLVAEEVFSGNNFPDITAQPYVLTLGPHNFYWLALRGQKVGPQAAEQPEPLTLNTNWKSVMLAGDEAQKLAGVLRSYLKRCCWFGRRNKAIRRVTVVDSLAISPEEDVAYLLLLKVSYAGAAQEMYLLPVCFAAQDAASRVIEESPQSVITALVCEDGNGILYDGIFNAKLRNSLLDAIARGRHGHEQFVGRRGNRFKEFLRGKNLPLESRVLKLERSNTSVVYDNIFFLKLYRRLETGVNPDVEISRYLTEYTDYGNFPAYAGSLEWQYGESESLTIGLLLEFVPSESDAWTYMLDAVGQYLAQALTLKGKLEPIPEPPDSIRDIDAESIPTPVRDLMGPVCVDMTGLLGRRTAELHLALASLTQNPDVQPEPFSMLYQKSVYQSMRALTLRVLGELENSIKTLPEPLCGQAKEILGAKRRILSRLSVIAKKRVSAMKIRIHGDYHLGQVLYTGKDFVIIDFEGEPVRALGERRLKRSALRDVAGMIRSFHYAAYGGILLRASAQPADVNYLERWADLWYFYISGVFLDQYLQTVGDADLLPRDREDFAVLLDAFLLEKAVYELGYELNNRPDWLMIPIRGIQHILKADT